MMNDALRSQAFKPTTSSSSPGQPVLGLSGSAGTMDGKCRIPAERRELVTVIVPAFNEENTIAELLDQLKAVPYEKQVVVVDDGSTDATAHIVRCWQEQNDEEIELLLHPVNRGKGATIRMALEHARGKIVIIQDADLECSPFDHPALLELIWGGQADVVFGSRFLNAGATRPWSPNQFCVQILNWMVLLLYGRRITDEATCLKSFRTTILRRMNLRCNRFEFCPEVVAKLCRMRIPIVEVAVHYSPRTLKEGKKIRWHDGIQAIWTLLRWRFKRFDGVNNKTGERCIFGKTSTSHVPDLPTPTFSSLTDDSA
jgi:dolichol-phosphate mannosyltransferase